MGQKTPAEIQARCHSGVCVCVCVCVCVAVCTPWACMRGSGHACARVCGFERTLAYMCGSAVVSIP